LVNSDTLGGVLYLGVISTAGAFFLWNKGLQLTEASSGGLYFFFQPLVGTILGWTILEEKISWSFGVGALLIMGGVLLVLREY
jgi:drug/metabolite transporter (DMT)-like permease